MSRRMILFNEHIDLSPPFTYLFIAIESGGCLSQQLAGKPVVAGLASGFASHTFAVGFGGVSLRGSLI